MERGGVVWVVTWGGVGGIPTHQVAGLTVRLDDDLESGPGRNRKQKPVFSSKINNTKYKKISKQIKHSVELGVKSTTEAFAGGDAVLEEVLGVAEEFAGEQHHRRGAVPHLVVLGAGEGGGLTC